VALKLRRATADADAVRDRFVEFWREHGAHHFRVEEDVLLPDRVDGTDPIVARVLIDHVEIKRRASDLESAKAPHPAELNALGEMLDGHVRHEERVLFPMIEEALPEEQIERLVQKVEEPERSA
jgi:hemerythrin-like domain-containing protein